MDAPKPGDRYTIPAIAKLSASSTSDGLREEQLAAAWDQVDKLSRQLALYKPYAQAVRRILRRFDDEKLGSMDAFISICGVRFDGEIE